MKPLIEITEDYKILTEENSNTGEKDYYIEGVFLQSEVKNKNGRIYPKEILINETNRYINESVLPNRALGELGHPQSPQINLDNVCILVTELKEQGNDVYGKAKVLSEGKGKTVRGFINDGVSFGVSSRALGSVKRKGGYDMVQEDFRMFAIDVVADPSAPNAYVNSLMENKEWIYDNGIWKEKDVQNEQEKIDEAHRSVDQSVKQKAIVDSYYRFFKTLQ